MQVVVFGAGYVGLVTGVTFSYLGVPVTLIDIDPDRIDKIQRGIPPIYEQHLEALLRSALGSGHLTATLTPDEAVGHADVIFIAVNTPPLPSGEADMGYVRSAATTIGRYLNPSRRCVIVTKSTVPIGSANLVRVWVEDGYRETHGSDPDTEQFSIASNPEFLREGQALHDSFYPDRIVFGADFAWARDTVRQLFSPIIRQDFPAPEALPRPLHVKEGVPVASTDRVSSEMIKYAANAFLATKISFANEMAQIAEHIGADITAVMDGIGMDRRIGREFLSAGAGWGGSCFGKDISALIHTAREYGLEPLLLEATVGVNRKQRRLLVEKLQSSLKTLKGRRIAVLGLAFKPGTDDLRDAPAEAVIRDLCRLGARVAAYDPVAMPNARQQWINLDIQYADSVSEAVRRAEAALLITDWPQFLTVDWSALAPLMQQPLVVDGRNFLDPVRMKAWGYTYHSIGR